MSVQSQEKIQVLHVDDEPDFAALTTGFLERESDRFAVETATSADEGLERIDDRPPDCVVSDYNMPGMDGLEFLQAVREEYLDLPFILFTGKGSEAVASDAISAGVTDYLQKGTGSEQYELLANRIENAVTIRRSQQVAQQRKERLELFFEESPLGSIQWDDEFQVERLNAQAEELLGYDEAELRGESWETIVAESDREQVAESVEDLLKADGVRHVQNRNIRKDGDAISCEWHNRAVVDTDGSVRSIFSKFQDVTDRERRKSELEEYETIIEALTDAVYVLDEGGRFTYVNDEFVELVGYDRETIIGSTPSLIKDAEAVEQAEHQLGRLLSSDGPDTVTFEATIQSRDGDPIACEDHMGVLPYEGDQFDGSVGTLRDITARKEREQELQRTHDLMANMEQLADAGAWEYDSGTESLTVTDGARRLHGLGPGENLTLEAALEAVHPDDRDRLKDGVDACLETGEPYEVEVRFTPPDGALRWLTIKGERVSESDASSVMRGYIRDTTEEQAYQRDLKRFWTVFEELPDSPERTPSGSEFEPSYTLQSEETTQKRLESLIDTYQPVMEILNRASSREEAEQTVCNFLTATQAYDVAWAAEYTPETSELTPRFRSDPDEKITEEWTFPPIDPPTDRNLPQVAVETGAVQVVMKNQPVNKYEVWREHTVEHGFSGCAIVPLVYKDQTYGLIGVYTTRQSPFDNREQTLLQTVGNRLGRLIHEFFIEKQLHTDTICELTLRSTDSQSFFVRTATELSCTIEINDSIPTSGEAFIHYISISGTPVDEFVEAVEDEDVVTQVRLIRGSDDSLGGDVELKLSRQSLAGTLVTLGAVVTTDRVTDGQAEVVCEVPVGEDVTSLVARITDSFPETTLVSKYEYDRSVESVRQTSDNLLADVEFTERQRQTLRASVYGGYFESPRRSTATEIADALSLTQTTVSRHLRDAQRELFERMFERL